MDIKTRGIVLQCIKYAESSVIVKIYTERLGLVSYLVNGVRGSKTLAKASLLRPLTLLELDVTHRENKGLQRIKEYKRAYQYESIPFDTIKSAIALFMLEVVSKSLKEQDANEEMFQYVYDCFYHLDTLATIHSDFHLQFLMHYASYLGFAPAGEHSADCPYFDMQEGLFTAHRGYSSLVLDSEPSMVFSLLCQSNLLQPLTIKIARSERQQILQLLLKYYSIHLEGFSHLKSPQVLVELFN